MELNWSTFVLEIINFLVLVWILKRFLYKPVLDVIAARRKSIEDRLAEASNVQEEAETLKEQYAGRLSEWESEKREAREKLAREVEEERARRLADMQSVLEREKEKARVAEDRQRAEKQRAIEQQALLQGAQFSSRLLEQAAGPELEDRLLNLLIEGLNGLSEDRLSRLREQWAEPSQAIDVASAFALSEEQRERLTSALHKIADGSTAVSFHQDAELLAGLRIVIGAWVLAANVRDELEGFTEFARATR